MGLVKNCFGTIVLACFAAVAMSVPAVAQTKTKDKPVVEQSAGLALSVIADAREYCDRVAGNDPSVVEALDAAGWEPIVDSFGEVPYYHELEGALDYPGAGRAEIWGFIELYPSHIIGYCTFEILTPEIDFPVAEMNSMDGLTGGVEHTDQGTYVSLTNDEAPYHRLIQARQTGDSFFYQVTDIIERDD